MTTARKSFRARIERAIRVVEDPRLHLFCAARGGSRWDCELCGRSIREHNVNPVHVTFSFKMPGNASVVSAIEKAIECRSKDQEGGGRSCSCACHADARRHS